MADERPEDTPQLPAEQPAARAGRLSRWRRLRRVTLTCLALLIPTALLLLPAWSARTLARELSRFFHRPVEIGSVRYHLSPFEPIDVEILDLRILGEAPGDPPFLEVPRLRLVPSLEALFDRRLVLRQLRLERPRLRMRAFGHGGDDIPKMGNADGAGPSILIRRLVIEAGEFVLDHERVPLTLDLPDVTGRLARRAGRLSGELGFGPGRLQFGRLPALELGAHATLSLEGSLIRVQDAHLRARGTDLAWHGELRLEGKPTGTFVLRGPLDLAMLDEHVTRTGFDMRGDAFYDGLVRVLGSRLSVEGRLYGSNGSFDGVAVQRYDGQISWDRRGVILRGLALEALGGKGTVELQVPPRPEPVRLAAQLDSIDAEGLWRAVFDWGEIGLGGAATGELALEWPRGQVRRLTGRMALDIVARAQHPWPLAGRFEWSARDGRQRVERAQLHTPTTHANVQGLVEVDGQAELHVEAETSDLHDADELQYRVRRALGGALVQRGGWSGTGSFSGRWAGSLRDPLWIGRATARQLGYAGVVWGQAAWSGEADGQSVRSHSLVLRREHAELWLDGRAEIGEYAQADALDLTLRLQDWPAADFVKAFQWDLDTQAPVSGEVRLIGRRSAPMGTLALTSTGGLYYGIPFEQFSATARLRGSRTELITARARVGGGRIAAAGSLTLDAVYDGRLELDDVDVSALPTTLAPNQALGGRVSGEVTLAGPVLRPRLQGRLRSPHLFLGDEGLGALDATLRGLGDGHVGIEAELRSARMQARLRGSLQAAAPHLAEADLQFTDSSLDPLLRVFQPGLPGPLDIITAGSLRLDGPLDQPEALRVALNLETLGLRLPEHELRNPSPIRASLEAGRLIVQQATLQGAGTDLRFSGTGAALANGSLDFVLEGAADLRTLSAVTRRLRGDGAARLRLAIAGTRDAPVLDGKLELEGGGLRVRGFPQGIEAVRGAIAFSEREARFVGLTGVFGGGPIELEGNVAYDRQGLKTFDVEARGTGLSLRYPEGLRSILDADLRCFGDPERQWLTGTIDVRQALWNKRYELVTELLAGSASSATQASSRLPSSLRFDLKLRAPGTLRLDNNLAVLTARAELDLSGSANAPALIGRAEIERGRVFFQGNTYVIRRGTLDFANTGRLDPLFDIEAETRVRSYRVTLRVNGTLERVTPTLTADPPLSAVQILNLLAGADETTVGSLALSQTDQARLAAAGAATLAAGKLSEGLGLERGAERLLGLSRFSIDPSVVRGGLSNPTARLTVGKRITPDLSVLYSLDLRSAEDRVLTLEYTLSDRLSLLLTQSDPGGLGFDVRLRHTR